MINKKRETDCFLVDFTWSLTNEINVSGVFKDLKTLPLYLHDNVWVWWPGDFINSRDKQKLPNQLQEADKFKNQSMICFAGVFFPWGNNAQWSLLRQIDLSYICDIKSDIWVCVVLINNCYAIDVHVLVTRNSSITKLTKIHYSILLCLGLFDIWSLDWWLQLGRRIQNLTVNQMLIEYSLVHLLWLRIFLL